MPKEQEKATETPKINPDKGKKIKKVSLKINGTKETEAEGESKNIAATEKSSSPFSYEDLIRTWQKLSEKNKEKSLSLYTALTQHKPKLKPDNTVLLFVENSIQQDLINENITDILAFLHKELHNHHIRLETEIKQQGARQKAYLPKEKLEELIKKNPHIKNLKDELGLDLDY